MSKVVHCRAPADLWIFASLGTGRWNHYQLVFTTRVLMFPFPPQVPFRKRWHLAWLLHFQLGCSCSEWSMSCWSRTHTTFGFISSIWIVWNIFFLQDFLFSQKSQVSGKQCIIKKGWGKVIFGSSLSTIARAFKNKLAATFPYVQ